MGEGTSGSAHLAVPVVGQLQQCLVLLAEVQAQLCQQVGGCQVVPRHPRLLCLHRTQRLQPPRTRMTSGRQTGSRRLSCPAPRAPAPPPAGHPGGPASMLQQYSRTPPGAGSRACSGRCGDLTGAGAGTWVEVEGTSQAANWARCCRRVCSLPRYSQ